SAGAILWCRPHRGGGVRPDRPKKKQPRRKNLRMMPAQTRPKWLKGDFEATAWRAGYAAAVARGCWERVFEVSLGLLATTAGAYCRAALAAAHNPVNPPDAAELAAKRHPI